MNPEMWKCNSIANENIITSLFGTNNIFVQSMPLSLLTLSAFRLFIGRKFLLGETLCISNDNAGSETILHQRIMEYESNAQMSVHHCLLWMCVAPTLSERKFQLKFSPFGAATIWKLLTPLVMTCKMFPPSTLDHFRDSSKLTDDSSKLHTRDFIEMLRTSSFLFAFNSFQIHNPRRRGIESRICCFDWVCICVCVCLWVCMFISEQIILCKHKLYLRTTIGRSSQFILLETRVNPFSYLVRPHSFRHSKHSPVCWLLYNNNNNNNSERTT